jgi:hypothetical protein
MEQRGPRCINFGSFIKQTDDTRRVDRRLFNDILTNSEVISFIGAYERKIAFRGTLKHLEGKGRNTFHSPRGTQENYENHESGIPCPNVDSEYPQIRAQKLPLESTCWVIWGAGWGVGGWMKHYNSMERSLENARL